MYLFITLNQTETCGQGAYWISHQYFELYRINFPINDGWWIINECRPSACWTAAQMCISCALCRWATARALATLRLQSLAESHLISSASLPLLRTMILQLYCRLNWLVHITNKTYVTYKEINTNTRLSYLTITAKQINRKFLTVST